MTRETHRADQPYCLARTRCRSLPWSTFVKVSLFVTVARLESWPAALFVCVVLGACERPPPGDAGPPIGFAQQHIEASPTHQALDFAVWYPSAGKPRATRVGPARVMAVKDGPVVDSIRGLVLLSHGFGGSMLGHRDLAERLAQDGYIVVTPQHPDITGLESGSIEGDPLVARVRDLRAVLDASLAAYPQAASSVAAIGFSLGGYAVAVLAGLTPDFALVGEYCVARRSDPLLCSDEMRARMQRIDGTLARSQDWRADPRLHAVVLLAPGYGPVFGTPRDAGNSGAPRVMVVEAGADEELDNGRNSRHIAALFGVGDRMQSMTGAGHYIFMAPCPPALAKELPAICADPPGIDRALVHAALFPMVERFLAGHP